MCLSYYSLYVKNATLVFTSEVATPLKDGLGELMFAIVETLSQDTDAVFIANHINT